MKTIEGIPAFEVEFERSGKVFDRKQVDALTTHVTSKEVTDLIVFAHGWNNDTADARALYAALFSEVGILLGDGAPPGLDGRRFAFAAVLWPSKKFTDKELIPGGGAAALGSQEKAVIRALLKDLGKETVRLGKTAPAPPARRKKVDKALALLGAIDGGGKAAEQAAEQFVAIVRSLVPDSAAHPDDGSKEFFKLTEKKLLENLREPVVADEALSPGMAGASVLGGAGMGGATVLGGVSTPGFAGGAGGAAGLQDLGESVVTGLRRLLNFVTYYRMKERAGVVGSLGVAGLVRELRKASPKLRVHLAGHSFGGRLVTAATDALGTKEKDKVDTLTLLQAAYSHNGLAPKFDGKNDGGFRKIVTGGKVRGPILATCTKNDRAVGIAYPLASRIARQNANALGDANDPYGGIGRNGAVRTPEATDGRLQATRATYTFGTQKKIHNLNADAFIKDHNDIAKPEVAWALLSAVATT